MMMMMMMMMTMKTWWDSVKEDTKSCDAQVCNNRTVKLANSACTFSTLTLLVGQQEGMR